MANGHEAGTLILNQLKTFTESVAYFEQVLSPALLKGIDSCVEAFCDERDDWNGEFNLADENNCWLTPINWVINQDENDSESKAWFYIDGVNDNDEYWETLFCGVGSTGGEAGFMFDCNKKAFGGKKAWLNHLKKVDKILEDILALGFKNMNDGNFFLPIKLDSQLLAKTWDDLGKFKNDDECFQPINEALETLEKSVPFFDVLMQTCQYNTK